MINFIRTEYNIFEVVEERDLVYRVKSKGNPYNIYSISKYRKMIMGKSDVLWKLCDEVVIYIREHDELFHIDPEVFYPEDYDYLKGLRKVYPKENMYLAIWILGAHAEPNLKSIARVDENGKAIML